MPGPAPSHPPGVRARQAACLAFAPPWAVTGPPVRFLPSFARLLRMKFEVWETEGQRRLSQMDNEWTAVKDPNPAISPSSNPAARTSRI